MTTEYDDCEAYTCLAIAVCTSFRFDDCRCIAFVAPMQSSRLLPGSVLVQVQPEAPLRTRPLGAALRCQRRSGGFESRRPPEFQRSKTVLRSAVNRGGVGSSPAAGAVRAKPTGEASAFQAVPGEFDSRRPLHARAVQWVNAGLTCRRSLVRSQPRVPGRVLPGWPRNPGFHSGNTGSIPVHDARDSVV
jgi:hypothetical protein